MRVKTNTGFDVGRVCLQGPALLRNGNHEKWEQIPMFTKRTLTSDSRSQCQKCYTEHISTEIWPLKFLSTNFSVNRLKCNSQVLRLDSWNAWFCFLMCWALSNQTTQFARNHVLHFWRRQDFEDILPSWRFSSSQCHLIADHCASSRQHYSVLVSEAQRWMVDCNTDPDVAFEPKKDCKPFS